MDQNESTLFKLEVEEFSTGFLSETAKWAKFLSIVGFVIVSLILVGGVFLGVTLSSTPGFDLNSGMGGMSLVFSLIYFLIALLYFFPCLYMYRFSVRMKTALLANNQEALNSAFGNLKSCFKFMGITTIVFISLYLLSILFGALS